MADITDPEAVKFINEQVRPLSDHSMQLYWSSKSAQNDWTAKNLSSKIPNDASVVIDGSAQDGRTVITGADVNILMAHMGAMVADMEANSNLKRNQIDKISVNPMP